MVAVKGFTARLYLAKDCALFIEGHIRTPISDRKEGYLWPLRQ